VKKNILKVSHKIKINKMSEKFTFPERTFRIDNFLKDVNQGKEFMKIFDSVCERFKTQLK
jgi:hypothetical protein